MGPYLKRVTGPTLYVKFPGVYGVYWSWWNHNRAVDDQAKKYVWICKDDHQNHWLFGFRIRGKVKSMKNYYDFDKPNNQRHKG